MSAVPNALVLFNPVYDNGPEGYGHERVSDRWEESGVRCDLHLYEDQPHGFFNYRDGKSEFYVPTVREADKYLESLGYLKGQPSIE